MFFFFFAPEPKGGSFMVFTSLPEFRCKEILAETGAFVARYGDSLKKLDGNFSREGIVMSLLRIISDRVLGHLQCSELAERENSFFTEVCMRRLKLAAAH